MRLTGSNNVRLPRPEFKGAVSVEEALLRRRSTREYKVRPLSLRQLGQLLWAAQGVTDRTGLRAAPSAGALYPLELYSLAGEVTGLEPGIYKYGPEEHALARVFAGDRRRELRRAALEQPYVGRAPAVLVFCAVFERTTVKYGSRGSRYVHMEAGHAAQNVYLQAVSLGLGTVVVGAFQDDQVSKALAVPHREQPLYLMPIGGQ